VLPRATLWLKNICRGGSYEAGEAEVSGPGPCRTVDTKICRQFQPASSRLKLFANSVYNSSIFSARFVRRLFVFILGSKSSTGTKVLGSESSRERKFIYGAFVLRSKSTWEWKFHNSIALVDIFVERMCKMMVMMIDDSLLFSQTSLCAKFSSAEIGFQQIDDFTFPQDSHTQ